MLDYKTLADILNNNNNFVITTHVNPDADAIGSEMAVYQILKELGKTIHVVNYSATPYNLTFLDKDKVIKKYNPDIHDSFFDEADVLIALDFNSPKRIVKMEPVFTKSKALKVCIDHHQHPADFVDHAFIDVSYAATAHILFEFIIETNIVELFKEIAVPLYAAIMTDTGSFRFDRTTAEIHRIAAELLEAGVEPSEIYDCIYDQSKIGKLKLLGECLSNISLTPDGQIAYITITQDALIKSGAEESEVDGFVNYCLSIQGVKIGLLFFELKDGLKISLRSKGTIPVNMLAEELGGGGHTNAAGTRVFNQQLNGYIDMVLEKAGKYLNIFEQ